MSSEPQLVAGAYTRILDEELAELLQENDELLATLRKMDDEEQPQQYGMLVARLLDAALPQYRPDERVALVNRFIELIGARDGMDYLLKRKILSSQQLVTSVHRKPPFGEPWPLPQTSLNSSYLLTGTPGTPSLEHELRQEMRSADRVDILVSFIKHSGLRLLMAAFDELAERDVPIRIITTSYMGASDPNAIAWLVRCSNVQLKVSYDTEKTRLHAKAYQFYRNTGYSTAYIGSANISRAAITSGLEWTVKVTEQDQPGLLRQFRGEFEGYWENDNFETCREENLDRFRKAIKRGRATSQAGEARFLAEITPRPFQERILEKLDAERNVHNSSRNLVVAATGTGKTVVAALDYARYAGARKPRPHLLFVAHRIEILEQARDCFRSVLRDFNFGDILGGHHVPASLDHLFATVASVRSKGLRDQMAEEHYEFVVVDEAHHGEAPSYKPIYEHFEPAILLGLTATPERMDGKSILPEFNHRIAAEIRLPEALEERLLCPFHYFGVSDPVSVADEKFWSNGRYSVDALTSVYTGDDLRARQRVDALFDALGRYNPLDETTRAIGFCVSVKHAHYMCDRFVERGLAADTLLGVTDDRSETVQRFREGRTQFLFTVDVLNEGFDLPEINLVMLLRPTESLTVFLQQLGRGLRHSPGKDCLTVLDLVGQQNKKYRIDRKFAALLPRQRLQIDKEAEADFPHLPSGSSIQLERVAREHVIHHIRLTLTNLQEMIIESLTTQTGSLNRPPTFQEFVAAADVDPVVMLRRNSWSGWKSKAGLCPPPTGPDEDVLQKAAQRLCLRDGPTLLADADDLLAHVAAETRAPYVPKSEARGMMLHYLLTNAKSEDPDAASFDDLRVLVKRNPALRADLDEIVTWGRERSDVPVTPLSLPFDCPLDLHASYGNNEIKAAFGLASFATGGGTGVGVYHSRDLKAYIHLVTLIKSEQDFSPTTRYHDYLLSRKRLHWESQAQTSQESPTGQNYIHFAERGYTVLFFVRINKRVDGITSPFVFMGPASELLKYEGDRPIAMTWELAHAVPADFYELAKMAG